eukprot:500787_1
MKNTKNATLHMNKQDPLDDLENFGFTKYEIQNAIKSVKNENDISGILFTLYKHFYKLPHIDEMKWNEAIKLKDFGIQDISSEIQMTGSSGTRSMSSWENAVNHTAKSGSWTSDYNDREVWLAIDSGNGGKINAIEMHYVYGSEANSVVVSHSDDCINWTVFEKRNTPKVDDGVTEFCLLFGKQPNHKRFIKFEFVDYGDKYVGINNVYIYGKYGEMMNVSGNPGCRWHVHNKNIPLIACSERFTNAFFEDYFASKNKSNNYLVVDSTDYLIDTIQLVMIRGSANEATISTSKSYDSDSKEWEILATDKSDIKGANYNLKFDLKERNQRYIKIEFNDTKRKVRIRKIEIVASSINKKRQHDDQKEQIYKSIQERFEDVLIESMKANAEHRTHLVSEYRAIISKQQEYEVTVGFEELDKIERDLNYGPLSKEWAIKSVEIMLFSKTFIYRQQIISSLLEPTMYQQHKAAEFFRNVFEKNKQEIEKQFENKIKKYDNFPTINDKLISSINDEMEGFKNQNYKQGKNGRNSKLELLEKLKKGKFYKSDTEKAKEMKKAKQMIAGVKTAQKTKNEIRDIANRNEEMFQVWSDGIEYDPLSISSKYSVQQYVTMINWAKATKTGPVRGTAIFGANYDWSLSLRLKRLAVLLEEAMKTKKQTIHKFHLFCLSSAGIYEASDIFERDDGGTVGYVTRKRDRDLMEKEIYDEICNALNILADGRDIDKEYKQFIKFLLCWQCSKYYDNILQKAKEIMAILQKPLDREYERLTNAESRILSLELDENDKATDYNTNLELLYDAISYWYRPKTAMIFPKDLKLIVDEWNKLKFEEFDEEFKNIRIDDKYSDESVCISD